MSTRKTGNRESIKGTWQEEHSYSLAVKITGKTTIYLAGVGAWEDEAGKSLAGDFDGQTRAVFRQMRDTLKKAGATLDDIVTMTVFVTDMKYRPRFIEIRKEFFTKGYPASALIGIKELARPPMLVEIQAIAAVD
ncbi:MAG: RidA family protein [Deltaproteobacteria bacterium]|nr:RidA family protein [Deltaproteobacteria bacterium]